jgi:hypothetical protein
MIQQAASIAWQGHRPEISTERLRLRPICEKDLARYQALFADALVMKHYIGNSRTPEQTAKRFQGWLERWELHPFSAMAIFRKSVENRPEEFVGHAVLGHGDFEGDPQHGFSEAAIILTPEYWNARYAKQQESKQIGKAAMMGIGTEVKNALELFAKELVNKKFEVPVDVTTVQQDEAETLLASHTIKRAIRNPKTNKITSIFLPFTEVRVTCSKKNLAMVKILGGLAERTHAQVEETKADPERQLVKFSFEKTGECTLI